MYPRHYGIILENKEDFDILYLKCTENKAPFFEDLFEIYIDGILAFLFLTHQII